MHTVNSSKTFLIITLCIVLKIASKKYDFKFIEILPFTHSVHSNYGYYHKRTDSNSQFKLNDSKNNVFSSKYFDYLQKTKDFEENTLFLVSYNLN